MFQNNRYLTRGVSERIPLELQLLIWNALNAIPEPKDYFQIFRLSVLNGIQCIEHEQEQLPFKRKYLLPTIPNPVTEMVYIGEDLYLDKHVYSASAAKFSEILDYSGGKKMIALTENGVVFDIDNVIAAGTKWAWFNTWNKQFITKNGVFSDEYTEAHILKKTYQSDFVITLDELPDWDTYTPGSTEPTEPETVKGDVNADGKCNVADVVAMQKWLLASPNAALADWKAGDLCEGDVLDGFDLAAMKRELLND